jgi:hypothetical protein
LNVSVTSAPIIDSGTFSPIDSKQNRNLSEIPESSVHEIIFNLGLWLSGLESFLQVRNQFFGEGNLGKASVRDWTKEFYLTNSTLLLCSKLSLQLGKILKEKENSLSDAESEIDLIGDSGASETKGAVNVNEFSFDEIFYLSTSLKDSILIGDTMLRAAPLRFAEWTAWSNVLSEKLKQNETAGKLIVNAERQGETFLPQSLKDLLQSQPIPLAVEADLRVVLPLFAKILKWLDVIEGMIHRDEPLKPSMLLFARISEQAQAMMGYINNRLRRFSNQDDALFMMLDSTVYAASIEVKKVYNFELIGITEIRQTPSIRAKIETAHGLLNDCFQQIVVNFAQLVDPKSNRKIFSSVFKQNSINRWRCEEICGIFNKPYKNPNVI